jgi:hypothetical protein
MTGAVPLIESTKVAEAIREYSPDLSWVVSILITLVDLAFKVLVHVLCLKGRYSSLSNDLNSQRLIRLFVKVVYPPLLDIELGHSEKLDYSRLSCDNSECRHQLTVDKTHRDEVQGRRYVHELALDLLIRRY